jgi:cold shock CspA family protein
MKDVKEFRTIQHWRDSFGFITPDVSAAGDVFVHISHIMPGRVSHYLAPDKRNPNKVMDIDSPTGWRSGFGMDGATFYRINAADSKRHSPIRKKSISSGKYHMSYDNTSPGWPQLSMVSISSLVFDLTIRQIMKDFRVRGAGDADH